MWVGEVSFVGIFHITVRIILTVEIALMSIVTLLRIISFIITIQPFSMTTLT